MTNRNHTLVPKLCLGTPARQAPLGDLRPAGLCIRVPAPGSPPSRAWHSCVPKQSLGTRGKESALQPRRTPRLQVAEGNRLARIGSETRVRVANGRAPHSFMRESFVSHERRGRFHHLRVAKTLRDDLQTFCLALFGSHKTLSLFVREVHRRPLVTRCSSDMDECESRLLRL